MSADHPAMATEDVNELPRAEDGVNSATATENANELPRTEENSRYNWRSIKNRLEMLPPPGYQEPSDDKLLKIWGVKKVFKRDLTVFESWALTFTTINFVSGLASLFGWAVVIAGPKAAFIVWLVVGCLAVIVSLSMAEIASSLPVAGGIYFWSTQLGGNHGRFLSWLTGWWNWTGWILVVPASQISATRFLISAFEVLLSPKGIEPWFGEKESLRRGGVTTGLTMALLTLAFLINISHRKLIRLYFCLATLIFIFLSGNCKVNTEAFHETHNGINTNTKNHLSGGYAGVVSSLYPFWVFFGFDASVHISEETKNASKNVARGMWCATLLAYFLSIPILCVLFASVSNLESIYTEQYTNDWAEYLIQIVGKKTTGCVVLVFLWISGTFTATSSFMSAQRVTYSLARDGFLPFRSFLMHINKTKNIPIHAAILVYGSSILLSLFAMLPKIPLQVLGASSAMALNISYLFPILLRQFNQKDFTPGAFRLGLLSPYFAAASCLYIVFLVLVLFFPQQWPVEASNSNYGSWLLVPAITTLSVGSWCWLPCVKEEGGWRFNHGAVKWFEGPRQMKIGQEEENGRREEPETEDPNKQLSVVGRRNLSRENQGNFQPPTVPNTLPPQQAERPQVPPLSSLTPPQFDPQTFLALPPEQRSLILMNATAQSRRRNRSMRTQLLGLASELAEEQCRDSEMARKLEMELFIEFIELRFLFGRSDQ